MDVDMDLMHHCFRPSFSGCRCSYIEQFAKARTLLLHLQLVSSGRALSATFSQFPSAVPDVQ